MVFALLAIGVAVGAYFGLKPLIGAAEVGWVCMLAAFPFAMRGFFTYNGMPAERFLLAVIRSEILCISMRAAFISFAKKVCSENKIPFEFSLDPFYDTYMCSILVFSCYKFRLWL